MAKLEVLIEEADDDGCVALFLIDQRTGKDVDTVIADHWERALADIEDWREEHGAALDKANCPSKAELREMFAII